jgi:hypothetical protein
MCSAIAVKMHQPVPQCGGFPLRVLLVRNPSEAMWSMLQMNLARKQNKAHYLALTHGKINSSSLSFHETHVSSASKEELALLTTPDSIFERAESWRQIVRNQLHFAEQWPDRSLFVSYEELRSGRRAVVLQRVAAFCGVSVSIDRSRCAFKRSDSLHLKRGERIRLSDVFDFADKQVASNLVMAARAAHLWRGSHVTANSSTAERFWGHLSFVATRLGYCFDARTGSGLCAAWAPPENESSTAPYLSDSWIRTIETVHGREAQAASNSKKAKSIARDRS